MNDAGCLRRPCAHLHPPSPGYCVPTCTRPPPPYSPFLKTTTPHPPRPTPHASRPTAQAAASALNGMWPTYMLYGCRPWSKHMWCMVVDLGASMDLGGLCFSTLQVRCPTCTASHLLHLHTPHPISPTCMHRFASAAQLLLDPSMPTPHLVEPRELRHMWAVKPRKGGKRVRV